MFEQLVQACLKKQRGAEEALFKACHPFLWVSCRLYSNDEQEAMGFLNIGFYKILKGLPKWRKEVPFRNWSNKVLVNAIIDEKRKYYKKEKFETSNFEVETIDLVYFEDFEFHEEECEYIIRCIKKLPTTTAHVFSYFAIHDFTYEEISSKLGMSDVTVRWHVCEARRRLSEMLNAYKKNVHGKVG